jgi:hypothetical protein
MRTVMLSFHRSLGDKMAMSELKDTTVPYLKILDAKIPQDMDVKIHVKYRNR